MVVNSGVHSFLHANYHHQTVFAKFDLKMYYPSPYERGVWHYQEADAILITQVIHEFIWKRALAILIIPKNFISHETIVCDDKDSPCFNKRIKSLIQ